MEEKRKDAISKEEKSTSEKNLLYPIIYVNVEENTDKALKTEIKLNLASTLSAEVCCMFLNLKKVTSVV